MRFNVSRRLNVDLYRDYLKRLSMRDIELVFFVVDNSLRTGSKIHDDFRLTHLRLKDYNDQKSNGLIAMEKNEGRHQIIDTLFKIINKVQADDIQNYFYLNDDQEVIFRIKHPDTSEPYDYYGKMENGLPNGKGIASFHIKEDLFKGDFIDGISHADDLKNIQKYEGTKFGEALHLILDTNSKFHDSPLQKALLEVELGSLTQRMINLEVNGRYEKSHQPQKDIQNTFQSCIEVLQQNDHYDTISNLDFWSKRTFADPVDFLDANIAAGKRGVQIRRVILLDRDYIELNEEEKNMLKMHLSASKSGGITTRVANLNQGESLDIVSNIATIGGDHNEKLFVEVFYHQDKKKARRSFKSIVLEANEDKIIREQRRFDRWFEKGVPIGDYLSEAQDKPLLTYKLSFKHEKAITTPVLNTSAYTAEKYWTGLFREIKKQHELITYTAEELRERWKNGQAAIVVYKEEIVSFVSLIEVFSKDSHQEIFEQYQHSSVEIPDFKVLEFLTAWTKPELRRRGLNLMLRTELRRVHGNQKTCFVSLTCGYSSSPLAHKMGWTAIPWSNAPYVRELIGWFDLENNLYFKSGPGGRLSMHNKVPYDGTVVDSYNFDKIPVVEWEKHFSLWVENQYILKTLDKKIQQILKDDLPLWQQLAR